MLYGCIDAGIDLIGPYREVAAEMRRLTGGREQNAGLLPRQRQRPPGRRVDLEGERIRRAHRAVEDGRIRSPFGDEHGRQRAGARIEVADVFEPEAEAGVGILAAS